MSDTLRAIIVDDELDSVQSLERDISDYCKNVEIVALCENAKQGILAINKHRPDVVFLDIDMPVVNGFELLEMIRNIAFEVIFTTAYDKYAVRAFKISAVDYLLKPIDPDELVKGVEKVSNLKSKGTNRNQISFLIQQLQDYENNNVHRIALPTSEGLEFVDLKDILYCEADGTYSFIYFTNGKRLLISKNLRYLEDILCDYQFFRVHKSYIANLDHISKYSRGSGGMLTMKNGARIQVSRSKKEALLNQF
jgi:two-component system LytT family response regulator